MGGGGSYANRHNLKKSLFSVFNFSKSSARGRNRRADEYYGSWDEATSARKVWPSDEDKGGRWVADPRIDTKASAFIAHFHATRFSEPERQIFQQAAAAGKA